MYKQEQNTGNENTGNKNVGNKILSDARYCYAEIIKLRYNIHYVILAKYWKFPTSTYIMLE